MIKKSLFFLLPCTFLFACSSKKTVQQQEKKESCIITPELKKLIRLETVNTSQAAFEIELTGNVSYNQDNLFRYQSLASGLVQKVYFNLGDYVQKGQLLAELKTTELSEQKSSLSIAQSALKLAQRNLKATQNMHNDGLASDKELLEAQNDVNTAQSEINKIRESANIQGGNIEHGVLAIRAPMSGYIVEKKITNGFQVNAGDADLFVISDLKKVWVMANVYAAQLGKVQPGEQVDITTTAYPDQTFEGKITRLSNIFDPEEKVMKAIIEIDNSDLKLKPDMMVSVTVHQPLQREAIALPVNDVIFDNDEYFIVVYHNDCDVQTKTIKPFAHDRKFYYLEMDNGSVNKGDTMISQNQLLIFNKQKGQ